mgnify:CR=1 FL=1
MEGGGEEGGEGEGEGEGGGEGERELVVYSSDAAWRCLNFTQ